ncbi:alkaline phosphatase family protein [Mesoterricola silvestris]|nr:alkaline phosphatase family protein [Mesoterricola silvestris]
MLIFLLFLACLGLSAGGPVLVMSFDGLGSTQFTAETMPRFWALSQKGQRGEGCPPFPATTFNGHATLATGCWPEHHGIVANGFIDPVLGPVGHSARAEYLQREPLWVAATRSGVRTAVFGWPCGTGPWEGVAPWRLQVFKEGVPDAAALAFSAQALQDGARLVMTYLSGTDAEGHYHGPASPEVRQKLKRIDDEIAPWVERMLAAHPGLRVLLLADHGMGAMGRRVDIRPLLGQPATVIAHGGSAYAYLKAPVSGEAMRALAAAGLKAWRPGELPADFHLASNPRIGDLIVEAPAGTWIPSATSVLAGEKEKIGRAGAHGFDAGTPLMHTWLVALGTGKTTALPAIPLWDIAPTVASWLDIRWEKQPDGKVVEGLR